MILCIHVTLFLKNKMKLQLIGYTTNCVGKNFLPQITQIWTNFKFKNLIILILGFDTGIFELI